MTKTKALQILKEIGNKCAKKDWDGIESSPILEEALSSARWVVNNCQEYEVHRIYPGLSGDVVIEATQLETKEEHILFCYTSKSIEQYINPYV